MVERSRSCANVEIGRQSDALLQVDLRLEAEDVPRLVNAWDSQVDVSGDAWYKVYLWVRVTPEL